MLLLQNIAVGVCIKILAVTACASFTLFIALMVAHRIFIRKLNRSICNKTSTSFYRKKPKKHILDAETVHITIKILCAVSAVIFAFSTADFTLTALSFKEAKDRGMVKNPDTGAYDLTLGEIRHYNSRNLKESDIDANSFDALRGKIVVLYRYDCSDCLELYDDLKNLKDVVYISSRTKTGTAFRDYFNPNLLKVPSGIYIRRDGKPVTLELYYSSTDAQKVMFDYDNWNRLLNIQKQDLSLE